MHMGDVLCPDSEGKEVRRAMEKGASKKYEIDMCNGPLLGKIMVFTYR